MAVRAGNLFADVSAASAREEAFSEIFAQPGLKIERIISLGQACPPEFWYDQAWNEWVTVLKGSATLQKTRLPRGRCAKAITSSSPQGNATASSGRTRNGQRFGWLSISTPIQRR
jgi:cupin 2 domain-containing protein